ncbi:MAG: 6-phospho-3-hexuloisomerase [Deltaproteobacteria bacterium]|nr:MAG: 6-phospho-3-hexuloisomerase [Deltaproteobacteria bacterium]
MCRPRLSSPAILKPGVEFNFKQTINQLLAEITQSTSLLNPVAAESLIQELESAPRIFGYGSGRSGFILRTFCMRLMHLGFTIYYVGETITPRIQPQDLLLVVSGSGETPQSRELLRQARSRGARTVAFTAHPESAIGQEADLTVLIPGTTKLSLAYELESIQCPGSLFEQAAFLFFETVILMLYQRRPGRNRHDVLARHANLE